MGQKLNRWEWDRVVFLCGWDRNGTVSSRDVCSFGLLAFQYDQLNYSAQ